MFEKQIYQQRRYRLKEQLDKGILLIMGNEEAPRNYKDNTYYFRQDSNFLYFFGLNHAHLAGVIDVESGEEILFGTNITLDHIIWEGPQPSLAEQAASVGVAKTVAYTELGAYLADRQKEGRMIHYLPPYRADRQILLSRWLGKSVDKIVEQVSVPLIQAVVKLASVKSPEEIEALEEAVTISGEMHVAAMQAAKAGMEERELVGIVENIARARGNGIAYPVILTINGQTLHNHYHGNTLQSGQLVLGDFGAESTSFYAGDITRTFPVDTQFSSRQKDIYAIVLKALEECIMAIQPGVLYKDIHLLAATVITEGLKDLGLMKGNTADAVKQGAHALFFPHGIGHMLGLDVHDMEDLGEKYVGYTSELSRSSQFGLRSLRLARALEPGFAVTVEPGIYFIPALMDQWQGEQKFMDYLNYEKIMAYKDFSGVRIEDDVLVTSTGSRILGKPIPKTIAEVEALRS